jgi:hypothetical protein
MQPFPWRLHITITYNLPYLRLWYADVVTVIAYTPEVVCRSLQTSRQEKDGTWSEVTWFEAPYYLVILFFADYFVQFLLTKCLFHGGKKGMIFQMMPLKSSSAYFMKIQLMQFYWFSVYFMRGLIQMSLFCWFNCFKDIFWMWSGNIILSVFKIPCQIYLFSMQCL